MESRIYRFTKTAVTAFPFVNFVPELVDLNDGSESPTEFL